MRVSKILRSETWRQQRMLTDFLRSRCENQNAFKNFLTMTRHSTETIWKEWFLPILKHHLARRNQNNPKGWPVQVMGDVDISEKTREVLEKGPKYALPPKLEPVDKLAMVRNIASKTYDEKASQVISEGVDCLISHRKQEIPRTSFQSTIQELREKDLKLCISDKEGGFVVLGSGAYGGKASQALAKNFIQVDKKQGKVAKQVIMRLLQDNQLTSLHTKIKGTKEGFLEVFFSAKTHKEGVPFRAIVSERRTWQAHLSTFLSRQMSLIQCNDPYMIRNSEEVISYLQQKGSEITSGFSIDIQDMYYSIPHADLMVILRRTIEEQGCTSFQNAAGINVDTFLELLSAYLTATVVAHQEQHFVQRSGVCIGSRVAPLLCDLFLAARDRIIQEKLQDKRILAIFRYVDDFLILHTKEKEEDQSKGCIDTVLRCFGESCPKLCFTHEPATNRCIKFLDLKLEFNEGHVCWRYEPRSNKGFLPFASEHSKTIKRSVAITALATALNKSCHHAIEASFQKQISRLRESGYPNDLLICVCENICTKLRRRSTHPEETTKAKEKQKIAVLPYVHGITHKLKKIAARQDIRVVCSAPNKAYSMCRKVNEDTNQKKQICNVSHKTQYAPCETGVVYHIPLSCGKCYIGQTGRCVNERMREHAASVKGTTAGHLPAHCRSCRCSAELNNITIIARNKNTYAREMIETMAIEGNQATCVSEPSIKLSTKEKQFLRCFPPRRRPNVL